MRDRAFVDAGVWCGILISLVCSRRVVSWTGGRWGEGTFWELGHGLVFALEGQVCGAGLGREVCGGRHFEESWREREEVLGLFMNLRLKRRAGDGKDVFAGFADLILSTRQTTYIRP